MPRFIAVKSGEISIHAPAKGATRITIFLSRRLDLFQSTLPRRERRYCVMVCLPFSQFQSTLPRRERQHSAFFVIKTRNFNPRSREGSDPLSVGLAVYQYRFQSTLPRRERRDCPIDFIKLSNISIHAPAKGATRQRLMQVKMVKNFNPRSREGSDILYVLFIR